MTEDEIEFSVEEETSKGILQVKTEHILGLPVFLCTGDLLEILSDWSPLKTEA